MNLKTTLQHVGQRARDLVTIHVERRTLHDFVLDPDHVDRTESPEFREAKDRLRADGHYQCWLAALRGRVVTEGLQVHHLGAEWMFSNVVDFDALKKALLCFDPYGYSAAMKDQPITSVDDVRNMIVLSQPFHTGVDHKDGGGGTGIHALTMPSWLAQGVCLTSPVPAKGETFAQAKARIAKFERPA